jgi:hypothetical protein
MALDGIAGALMYGRALLMVLAAGACSHAGPVRAATVECRSVANAQTISGISADQACALIRERAQAALAAGGRGQNISMTIELDLARPGSAIARVRESRAGVSHAYPEIAVDVMDRPLRRQDLVRLADAVVGAVSAGPQSN